MHLLEQDMSVLRGQCEELRTGAAVGTHSAHTAPPLKELWCPLRTCDALVLHFRRWIDANRESGDSALRAAAGWSTPGSAARPSITIGRECASRTDRWWLHTRHCVDCRKALAAARRRESALRIAAYASVALAVMLPTPLIWVPLATGASAVLGGRWARRTQRLLTGDVARLPHENETNE